METKEQVLTQTLCSVKQSVETAKECLELAQESLEKLNIYLNAKPKNWKIKSKTCILTFKTCVGNFVRDSDMLIELLSELVVSRVDEILKMAKYEQRRMANANVGILVCSIEDKIRKIGKLSTDVLETIKDFVELLKGFYSMFSRTDVLLPPTNNFSHSYIAETKNQELYLILKKLLNASLVVESQPQIIKFNTNFCEPVLVSLWVVGEDVDKLVGLKSEVKATMMIDNKLNELSPWIVDGMQIVNGVNSMEFDRTAQRYIARFERMRLIFPPRANRKQLTEEIVTKAKSCLRFVCTVNFQGVDIKLTTDSLPIVVISHSSQMPMAMLAVAWDNAFFEEGRKGFQVRSCVLWIDVTTILNAFSLRITGRGLSQQNLKCLAKKAFGGVYPQPEYILLSSLEDSRFWYWFYVAIRMIGDKDLGLEPHWKNGLIHGFFDRETPEDVLKNSERGTFIVRFIDERFETLSIFYSGLLKNVVRLGPYKPSDLKVKNLAKHISEIVELTKVYQDPPMRPRLKTEFRLVINDIVSDEIEGYTLPYCVQHVRETNA